MASPGAAASPRRGHSPLLLAAALLLALAVTPTSTTAAGRGAARECTYTLRVKTSCASPAARTSDAVAVAFGDAYRNAAHAARLPTTTPGSRALERCGTDTFRLPGPCGYGVCYLYLRRDGRDGWTPEWAQVVEPGPRSGNAPPATATFYFGDPLPDGVWYGHDRCTSIAAATDAAARTASKSSSAASPRG
ncbi:hypothetical protein HU200_020602 [Digitaria exilis]|uniref:Uncharacterized protein n=1 Tax=Digitaria exilis TaxID=1010633 RepID=A0A835KDU6_9POAL|nr:hypothetical protein HU200_020602 [Digitaria exilis]CAB3464104.1 unnamed protein product [Digitaria exilis]